MTAPVIWFTGLSGSGKTTLCQGVAHALTSKGVNTCVLDGDSIRKSLSSDLGYTDEDRIENVRRLTHVSGIVASCQVITLVAAITPMNRMRSFARQMLPRYAEIYLRASLRMCEARDVKGLYRAARSGRLSHFTGLSSTFEEPECPDLICDTDVETVEESMTKVLEFINGVITVNRT